MSKNENEYKQQKRKQKEKQLQTKNEDKDTVKYKEDKDDKMVGVRGVAAYLRLVWHPEPILPPQLVHQLLQVVTMLLRLVPWPEHCALHARRGAATHPFPHPAHATDTA